MARVLMLFLSLVLLTACSCDRVLTLSLDEEHSWEEVSGRPLWYSLTYNLGSGSVSASLSVGQREMKLIIPRAVTVVFAAYPLGSLAPLGGAVAGDEDGGTLALTSEEGPLCDYLLRINRDWPKVVEHLNYRRLASEVRRHPDIHYPSLMQLLITGKYCEEAIITGTAYTHSLDSIPTGRYYLDGYELTSFYKGEYRAALLPPLPAGRHCFFNYEKLLVFTLFISDRENVPPSYLIRAPEIIFTISESEYHALYKGGRIFQ